jgi:hypothetical protein
VPLTSKQRAFDEAIKARNNFDYPGIYDLDQLRDDPTKRDRLNTLTVVRDYFNAALEVEGQNQTGHVPHAPFYLDFAESHKSQGFAFKDANHSFIALTVPEVDDVTRIATTLQDADDVVAHLGLPSTMDRRLLATTLFFQLLGFIVTHEYTHVVHGHLDVRTRGLERQALEADADGYSAYYTLSFWLLEQGRQLAIDFLQIQHVPKDVQDGVIFSCFVVAQAAFTFLREPDALDKDRAYHINTHPPQPVRLKIMSSVVMKFSGEFVPSLRTWMTAARYQSLMTATSKAMWSDFDGPHALAWRAQREFLDSNDGQAYVDAIFALFNARRGPLF